MPSFASAFVGKAGHGKGCLINGHWFDDTDIPKGCVAVNEDGWARFYRVRRDELKAFREWMAEVYSGMNCNQITGAWPAYHVRRR